MTLIHRQNLIRFNTRMSMHIGGPITRESIVSYLQGYQSAAGSDCDFLGSMSKILRERYGLLENNWGWWGQLQSLAEKLELDWIEAYYLISFEVLRQEFLPTPNASTSEMTH